MRKLGIVAVLVAALAGRAYALTSGNAFITVQNGQISITGTLTVTNGGTGASTLTAHNVVLGNGTSAVAFAAPGTTGIPFLSQGASSDPAFTAINLSDTNVTTANALPISRGGTNSTTALNNGRCIHSSGGALVETSADCATPLNPVVQFGTNGNLTTNTSMYANLSGCTDSADINCESIIQGTHTWKNIECWNDSIQGSGSPTHDIEIQLAKGSCGTAFASLTTASMPLCTISGSASANQTCTDTTNTLNPTAGQCVVARIKSNANVNNTAHVNCSIEQVS